MPLVGEFSLESPISFALAFQRSGGEEGAMTPASLTRIFLRLLYLFLQLGEGEAVSQPVSPFVSHSRDSQKTSSPLVYGSVPSPKKSLDMGVGVADKLDCSPPNKANRVQSSAETLQNSQVGTVPDDAAGRGQAPILATPPSGPRLSPRVQSRTHPPSPSGANSSSGLAIARHCCSGGVGAGGCQLEITPRISPASAAPTRQDYQTTSSRRRTLALQNELIALYGRRLAGSSIAAVRLGTIPGRANPLISSGRWVFSGISRLPCPCILALLNFYAISPRFGFRDLVVKSHLNISTHLKKQLVSHQGEPGSIPDRITPGFSQMGIVPDDAAGRRVFSVIFRSHRVCIPALLHSRLISPTTLKTSMLTAAKIAQLNSTLMKEEWDGPHGNPASMVKKRGSHTSDTKHACLAPHRSYAQGDAVIPARPKLLPMGDSICQCTRRLDWGSGGERGQTIEQRMYLTRVGAAVAERLACPPPTKVNRGSTFCRITPGFSHLGIVSDDDTGRRVFSGISRFSRPLITALLHTHLNHPHRLSSAQISSLIHSYVLQYT
ncbi:hypothetical protein PR048_012088, partial [Dryococelus australis]